MEQQPNSSADLFTARAEGSGQTFLKPASSLIKSVPNPGEPLETDWERDYTPNEPDATESAPAARVPSHRSRLVERVIREAIPSDEPSREDSRNARAYGRQPYAERPYAENDAPEQPRETPPRPERPAFETRETKAGAEAAASGNASQSPYQAQNPYQAQDAYASRELFQPPFWPPMPPDWEEPDPSADKASSGGRPIYVPVYIVPYPSSDGAPTYPFPYPPYGEPYRASARPPYNAQTRPAAYNAFARTPYNARTRTPYSAASRVPRPAPSFSHEQAADPPADAASPLRPEEPLSPPIAPVVPQEQEPERQPEPIDQRAPAPQPNEAPEEQPNETPEEQPDAEEGADAVPTERMAAPVPVDLSKPDYSAPKKQRIWPWVLLSLLVVIAATTYALWETGLYKQLPVSLPGLSELFGGRTAAQTDGADPLPTVAGDGQQSASATDAPLAKSLTVDENQAVVPADLVFTVITNRYVTNIRLANGIGIPLNAKITSHIDGENVVWEGKINFASVYRGDVSLQICDQNGDWSDTAFAVKIEVH